ncbi:GTP cyclohydrolase I [Veillonella criceti]|uniref:GTP cyclohydrolase 1 n=1 Tax=Veillonella criceti TaxID=103891 RepID=A0A380NJN1_9FIRM|nr:GTP cyclohydrolase I [Veillonella criceti]SUP42607.1 GTP cyclohydrolase 1 [Veillonella criceti]
MKEQASEGIAQFLTALGIDLKAAAMEKTPNRVASLYEELFAGMNVQSADIWGEIFPTEYKGLVAVTDIPFYSVCEHHLMPFFGTVDIVYQPKEGRVAGLSKLSDLVNVFARRPQLQERMTRQIATALETDLLAEGVVVRIKATHLCMLIKGELQQGTAVVTMECRGVLSKTGQLREEAMAILGGTTDVQTTQL